MKKIILLCIAGLLLQNMLACAAVQINSVVTNTPTPILIVNCAEGKDVIYSGGALVCSSGTPTVSSCGTGSPAVSGSDLNGVITAGAGVLTACTLNFSHTLSATPKCLITTSLGAAWLSATSSTAITVTATTLTSASIYYKCWDAT